MRLINNRATWRKGFWFWVGIFVFVGYQRANRYLFIISQNPVPVKLFGFIGWPLEFDWLFLLVPIEQSASSGRKIIAAKLLYEADVLSAEFSESQKDNFSLQIAIWEWVRLWAPPVWRNKWVVRELQPEAHFLMNISNLFSSDWGGALRAVF